MANHKSAEKRARQSLRRNERNQKIKSALKTFEKKVRSSIGTKSSGLTEDLRVYTSQMMKAVSKGILKKETAARKISRLSHQAHRVGV